MAGKATRPYARPTIIDRPQWVIREHASQLLPRVHRAFSNLKTWLKGTHHGVSAKHLPHYVDEFVFRFNRRRTPMAAFQSLLGLTTQYTPTTYKMLYSAEYRIGTCLCYAVGAASRSVKLQ